MSQENLNGLTQRVIGAAIEVHKALGPGFIERAYAKALQIELNDRGIAFTTEAPIKLSYKGKPLGLHRLDLVVADALVIELKAVYDINHFHLTQMLSYLKASGKRLGLIMNFGRNRVQVKRVAL